MDASFSIAWKIVVGLGAALFAQVADAAVIVVDAGGGGDFVNVSSAVAASVDGDIIVVRSGDYRVQDLFGIGISGRAITLIGEGATRPLVNQITIQSLSSGESCVVRGFDFSASPFAPTVVGVSCQSNAGDVMIEDCSILGPSGAQVAFGAVIDGGPGVTAVNSHLVVLTRCVVAGGRGIDAAGGINQHGSTRGGPGVFVSQSSVTASDCDLQGGRGGDGPPALANSNRGGHGVHALSGTVRMAGCAVAGGRGGDSLSPNVNGAGTGGDGLVVAGQAHAESFASTFIAGVGGVTTNAIAAASGVAQNLFAPSSHVVIASTAARTFALSSPVVPGQNVQVTFGGVPGEAVFVLPGFGVGHVTIFGTIGWLAVKPPYVIPFSIGTVGPGGTTSYGVPAPPLAQPTLEGEVFLFQSVFVNPNETVIGPSSAFVLRAP